MTDESLYGQLLDALYSTFGNHAGYRVTHARGVLAHGSFIASKQAGDLSRAAHLQGDSIPVILRFSNFSGIPSTPDSDAMASPRGLALRFMVSSSTSTDIVAHSFDGFPVGTPHEFLDFLKGIASASAEPPNPVPLS